jgi:hypothetical protein
VRLSVSLTARASYLLFEFVPALIDGYPGVQFSNENRAMSCRYQLILRSCV